VGAATQVSRRGSFFIRRYAHRSIVLIN
jgi:hypothetical protein